MAQSRTRLLSSGSKQAPSAKLKLPFSFRRITERSRYKVFKGGRGSAKSHTIASVLVSMGAERELRIMCVREIQKSIKTSSKKLLEDKIKQLGLSWFYTITNNEIVGLNGTTFMFAGLRTNPEAITSTEGIDIVWIEEARTVSKISIELLVPTIRKEVRDDAGNLIWKSELWFSYNPRHPSDPVDTMFFGPDGAPPDTIIFDVNYTENPWFPQVLRDEMEWDKRRDPDKYAHIWLGQYRRNSESAVFRNWRIDELTVAPDERVYLGADWGFSVDPTVLVKCHLIEPRTLYIEAEAYKVGCEIDHTPELFENILGAKRWPIRADSARPETISFMRRKGWNIVGAAKGPGSVEDGIEFLKSCDIVVHPSCTHCIDELTMYSYKIDKLTSEVLPLLADKNNHVIDAIRYALEGARKSLAGMPSIRRL